MKKNNLAGSCGVYCGACRAYLLEKKDLFEEKRYKVGCKGCKEQDKNCAFVKKGCKSLRTKEIEYCFECEKMPCEKLASISNHYKVRYHVGFLSNLERMKEVGVEQWLEEQKMLYTCSECGGEICVHDAECFDCGHKGNPNIKIKDYELVGSCGLYCGACKFYLSKKKGIAEQKGHKRGCNGCQTRKTKCDMIKKTCSDLRKDEITYCYDCIGTIPCQRLERMENKYVEKYNVSLVKSLERMKEVGVVNWLEEQAEFYKCPECGGEICLHDEECYDCGYKINPNIK